MHITWLEEKLINTTKWLGTPSSFVVHTLFFVIAFLFIFFGISFDKILLIVTTIVSLEAIYLAIFIQMTVNRQAEDIEDIQEEVEDISEDIDKIQEKENTKNISKKIKSKFSLSAIKENLPKVFKEIKTIKKTNKK